MRTKARSTMVAVLVGGAMVLAACGDDGYGGGGGSDDDGAGAVGALGDDSTLEQCLDVVATVLGRIEVPDGFDPADGVDDAEREAAADAIQAASDGLFDIDDDDHPCTELLDAMPAEDFDAFMEGLDLDPMVLAVLGSRATAEFTPIEDEL